VCKNLLAGVLSPKINLKNGIESEFLKRTLEIDAKFMVVIGLMKVSYIILYTITIRSNLLLSISVRPYTFIITCSVNTE